MPPATPSRLGRSALFGVIGQVLALGIGLWSTPQLLAGLGEEPYGVLAILTSFIAYFAYLELGLGAAYLRELALALSRQQDERAQRLVETAHALYTRIGVLGAGLMLASGTAYFAWALRGAPTLWPALLGLAVSSLSFFLSMWLSAARGAVFSAQRPDLFTRASMWMQPLIPLLQVAGVWAGLGLAWVLLVPAAMGIGIDLLMRWHAHALLPAVVFRRRFHPEVWSELKSFSLYKFVYQLAQQGQVSSDRLLLGFLVPVAQLAPYAVAASIALRVRALLGAITSPFFTVAVGRFGTDGAEGLGALLRQFSRRAALLLALAIAGASFLAAPFLAAWVGAQGPAYVEEGSAVLSISIVTVSLVMLGTLAGQATDAAGHPKAMTYATGAGLLVSLALGALLSLWMGAVGVAWGFLAGAGVQFAASVAALARFVGRTHALAFLSEALLQPALVSALAYTVMISLPHGTSLWSCLPAAAAGSLSGLFSSWFGCLAARWLLAFLRR